MKANANPPAGGPAGGSVRSHCSARGLLRATEDWHRRPCPGNAGSMAPRRGVSRWRAGGGRVPVSGPCSSKRGWHHPPASSTALHYPAPGLAALATSLHSLPKARYRTRTAPAPAAATENPGVPAPGPHVLNTLPPRAGENPGGLAPSTPPTPSPSLLYPLGLTLLPKVGTEPRRPGSPHSALTTRPQSPPRARQRSQARRSKAWQVPVGVRLGQGGWSRPRHVGRAVTGAVLVGSSAAKQPDWLPSIG